jgi:hypothetical protein
MMPKEITLMGTEASREDEDMEKVGKRTEKLITGKLVEERPELPHT